MASDSKLTISQPPLLTKPGRPMDILQLLTKEMKIDAFKDVRIFGMLDNPYYIASDVEKALGQIDTRYREEKRGTFKWGLHKVEINLLVGGRMRDVIAFTSAGLHKALFHIDNDICDVFIQFVTDILKKLFADGVVTLDNAIKTLHEADAKNKEMAAKIDTLKHECQEANASADREIGNANKYRADMKALKIEIGNMKETWTLKAESKRKAAASFDDTQYCTNLLYNYGVPIYVVEARVPGYPYDDSYPAAIDDATAVYTFRKIRKLESKDKRVVATVFLHPKPKKGTEEKETVDTLIKMMDTYISEEKEDTEMFVRTATGLRKDGYYCMALSDIIEQCKARFILTMPIPEITVNTEREMGF